MKTMQMQMALDGEASSRPDRGRDEFIAARLAESPTGEARLMEAICERENRREALKRVEQNKGAPGVDGMKTGQLRGYLRRHWEKIKSALLDGTHQPMPVRRKEIEKEGGGVRLLGIPTVLDRLIQQAVAQVLTLLWDHTFSEYSYGFRPGRSAQMAIETARKYVEDGYTYVVDIDLSKFFDRVNHDRLMSRLATRIQDKRVLKLIRAYLNSGVLVGDVFNSVSRASWGKRALASTRKALGNSVSGCARSRPVKGAAESGGNHQRTEQIAARLGGIFPLRSQCDAGRNAGPLDKATPTGVCLETVEVTKDSG